ALYFKNSEFIDLKNNIFKNNIASNNGGTVAIENYKADNFGYFINNTFISNKAKNKGGAIYIKEGLPFEIMNSNFSKNEGEYGGTFYYERNKYLNIIESF